jgi:hypothetical protein
MGVEKIAVIMQKINKYNVKGKRLSEYQDYVIHRISETTRIGSNKLFNGKPNCSGLNLWNWGHDNMTVSDYQKMIKEKCDKNDPQYNMTKHLRYDIRMGFVELIPTR